MNLVDKIIFGVLLIFMFQVPVLSDHYLQFLSGYYESTKGQVDGFYENAQRHNYPNAYAMIDDFMRNSNSAVRRDGEQKLETMREYEDLARSVSILQDGYLLEKVWFILNPARWPVTRQVLVNFQPGIPLSPSDLIYAVLLALIINFLIMLPFRHLTKSK